MQIRMLKHPEKRKENKRGWTSMQDLRRSWNRKECRSSIFRNNMKCSNNNWRCLWLKMTLSKQNFKSVKVLSPISNKSLSLIPSWKPVSRWSTRLKSKNSKNFKSSIVQVFLFPNNHWSISKIKHVTWECNWEKWERTLINKLRKSLKNQ